jgi:hypothetical protein
MELKLSVVSKSDAEDLRSLRDWIVCEDDLRTNANISMHTAPPSCNEMGGDLSLIELVLGAGFNMASLVVAIASWRETRRSKPTIEVQVNERIVILESSDQCAIEAAIRQLGSDG